MKISFCTTCMNRFSFLELTLRRNMELVKQFNDANTDKLELTLCNYDSKDNLHEYIMKNYLKDIEAGRLQYIYIGDKEYFNCSHAKNIAYKIATGDVVINLDGDNYLCLNLIEFIHEEFSNNDIDDIMIRDLKNIGMLGMSKANFIKLGGYSEVMYAYGHADKDLIHRSLKYLKCKEKNVPPEINYLEDYCIQQWMDTKFCNYEEKTVDGVKLSHVDDTMAFNLAKKILYDKKNIMNPNKHEGIEFGKIDDNEVKWYSKHYLNQ